MFNKEEALERVLTKLEHTSLRIGSEIPYRTKGGVYDDMSGIIESWTNGFWSGILWLAYSKNRKKEYAVWATEIEEKLDTVLREFEGISHDLGFMWQLSAVANYKLSGNKASALRGKIAASFLASRFNPAGNFIRAWGGLRPGEENTGFAIIDCMMNLSLLYWASDYTGDPRFSNIAQAYAETVMKYFVREDGSVKHICKFNPVTGEYIGNLGGQGYGEDSSWSRGAAWALYGFSLNAKYTGRQDFLNTSKRVANFFIAHLPEDSVPFADFKAPADINIHKDSSAAATAASGLMLLSKLVPDNEKNFYSQTAEKIVASLYNNYTDWNGDEALIQKGCVAFHASAKDAIETSLIYGDYFFLEALMQMNGYEELF